MSTLTAIPLTDERERSSDRVVLHDVPWDLYVRLRDLDANQHVRMTYYRGVLELMSPRFRHEKYSFRLGQLVMTLAAVMDIPCSSSRSTTFRRAEQEAGKEADQSFYFAHEPFIRDKDDIDLALDPPPDLAIEVDNLSDSEWKLPVYAALGVPEVWRYDARTGVLWFGRLQADGSYSPIAESASLPSLTPERALDALRLCHGVPESRWDGLLREWARATLM